MIDHSPATLGTTMIMIDETLFKEVGEEVTKAKGYPPRDPTWLLRRIEIGELLKRIPAGGSLLDIGSGPGFVPRYFHRLGYEVVSVDYPAAGGMDALGDLMKLGIEGHYTQVGFEKLPLEDNRFDAVFAGNVIEHLPNSPRIFIEDLKRVTKPGGHLTIDTKNAVDLKTRIKVLLGIPNWAPLSTFFDLDIHPHHHKEYNLSELKDAFVRTGFDQIDGFAFECFLHLSLIKFGAMQAMGKKKEEVSTFGTGFNPLQPYEYLRILGLGLSKLRPGLRSDIIVTGRKPLA